MFLLYFLLNHITSPCSPVLHVTDNHSVVVCVFFPSCFVLLLPDSLSFGSSHFLPSFWVCLLSFLPLRLLFHSSSSPGGPEQRRLKVSFSCHNCRIRFSSLDWKQTISSRLQCQTSTTWFWMRITLDPGGCRTSGGKAFVFDRQNKSRRVFIRNGLKATV